MGLDVKNRHVEGLLGLVAELLQAMGLDVKNRHVEGSAREAAQAARETKTEAIRRPRPGPFRKELLDWLEYDVWPAIPETALGKRVTKRERERILGYGKVGV